MENTIENGMHSINDRDEKRSGSNNNKPRKMLNQTCVNNILHIRFRIHIASVRNDALIESICSQKFYWYKITLIDFTTRNSLVNRRARIHTAHASHSMKLIWWHHVCLPFFFLAPFHSPHFSWRFLLFESFIVIASHEYSTLGCKRVFSFIQFPNNMRCMPFRWWVWNGK